MKVGKESGNKTLRYGRYKTVGKMQMKLSVSGGGDVRKTEEQ